MDVKPVPVPPNPEAVQGSLTEACRDAAAMVHEDPIVRDGDLCRVELLPVPESSCARPGKRSSAEALLLVSRIERARDGMDRRQAGQCPWSGRVLSLGFPRIVRIPTRRWAGNRGQPYTLARWSR